MWHATCTQINEGNSWLLVVKSQIGTLTPSLSFSNNLCFNYSNESCKPIFDIFISRSFQWYKELFNLMIFGPWNCSLKIQESIKTLIPKVGAHLRVCGFIPSHFPIIPGEWMWPPGYILCPHLFKPLLWLQTLALVASPRLGSWHHRFVAPTTYSSKSHP